jgi:hypothetical protein
MPDARVDRVATSPPFWALRDYGTGGWAGGDPGCSHHSGRGLRLPDTACRRCPAVWTEPAARPGADRRAVRRSAGRRLRRTRSGVEAVRDVLAQPRGPLHRRSPPRPSARRYTARHRTAGQAARRGAVAGRLRAAGPRVVPFSGGGRSTDDSDLCVCAAQQRIPGRRKGRCPRLHGRKPTRLASDRGSLARRVPARDANGGRARPAHQCGRALPPWGGPVTPRPAPLRSPATTRGRSRGGCGRR